MKKSYQTEAKRRRVVSNDGTKMSNQVCPECGKNAFRTRKAAKSVLRKHFQGEQMMTYRCGDFWHLAHKPYLVMRSVVSRDEIRDSGKYKHRIEDQ